MIFERGLCPPLESCDLCPGIAIREMHRLVRCLMLDEDGIPDQGILFRHLPPVARGG